MTEKVKLQMEYERKLTKLQETCPHEELTELAPQFKYCASIYAVRRCKLCDKIVVKVRLAKKKGKRVG